MTYRIPSTPVQIPEIGYVVFNQVSVGLVSEALKLAKDYPDDAQRAEALVSRIVIATAQGHEFTSEEVLSLSNSSLITILEAIRVVPEFKDIFDKVDVNKPFVVRVYDAILTGWAKFWSEAGAALRPAAFGVMPKTGIELAVTSEDINAIGASIANAIPKSALDLAVNSLANAVPDISGLTAITSAYSRSISRTSGLNTLAGSYANVISEIAEFPELAGLVKASSQSLNEQLRPLASTIADYMASTGIALKLHADMQGILTQLTPSGLDKIQGALGVWAKQVSKLALPEPFFTSSLIAAGLNIPKIHTVDYSYLPAPALSTIDDLDRARDSFDEQRMRDAYDVLMNLELTLRRLIIDRFDALGDAKWWKRRIPDGVKDDANRLKAEDKALTDKVYHPIDYTYIGGLKEIIVRTDNWDEIFGEIFINKSTIQVSLDHCSRVRSLVMHFRAISDTDYHLLLGNAQMIIRLIEAQSKR